MKTSQKVTEINCKLSGKDLLDELKYNFRKARGLDCNKMLLFILLSISGNIKENLKDALSSYFEQEQTDDNFNQEAIVESKPLTVVIWRDDGVFYCFDSKPRDKNGMVIGSEDWSEYDPPRQEDELEGERKQEGQETSREVEEEEGKVDEAELDMDVTDEDEEEGKLYGGGDYGPSGKEKQKITLRTQLQTGEEEG